jgi:hypothetical protein
MKSCRPQLIFLIVALAASSLNVSAQTAAKVGKYEIKLYAVDNVDIRDKQGSVLRPFPTGFGLVLRDVDYAPGSDVKEFAAEGDDTTGFVAPHEIAFLANTANHEIRFRTGPGEYMRLEILRRGREAADRDLIIRYIDIRDIKPGVNARIKLTSTSVSDLRVDNDDDGTYETTIKPRFRVEGALARDDTGPIVKMNYILSGNTATIKVLASDVGTGVQDVRYRVGEIAGNFSPYTGPFTVDISRGEVGVYVLAADRAGNVSGDFKYFDSAGEKAGYDPYNLKGPPMIRPAKTPDTPRSSESDPYQLKSKPE